MIDEELSAVHFGQRIEARAEAWYLAHSPRAVLLERNFRWRGGEIDLIFEEPGASGRPELVFVEVRARLAGSLVSGIESVRAPKLIRLKRTISVFLARYRGKADSARLDLLAWDGHAWEHWEDALKT